MRCTPTDTDLALLRRTFDLAGHAAARGIHPFAAILVGPEGEVLMEQINAYLPDLDMTGHAERVLMTRASTRWRPDFLARCTLYVSAEPCCMCAGAAYWAGLGRLVYGVSEKRLKALTGNHPENPTLDLPCRTVFAAGQRPVTVLGPLLEDEAAEVHETFWRQQREAGEDPPSRAGH
ncbi:nucleoside deaminase [Marinobacter lutaoensis]|uniref:tRNA-specific adenosine deaminase n=1 Tax=Marinobacter lutaoensis TaxID=135739 RepID=A0A1V2DTA8_9GAMM|nr:nucleoside deaminase [Marinobacter lutaoensis]MBI44440.1 nucleoside deaminase [Oceanospirillales bacterium]NVD35829.1 nucleoside deaminase [Marinobacter lutaoensis]ONF43903.1 tRNA-specific adenosine deaminase [Marinobacter lutaoensis]